MEGWKDGRMEGWNSLNLRDQLWEGGIQNSGARIQKSGTWNSKLQTRNPELETRK
jgi:hypothetical protein